MEKGLQKTQAYPWVCRGFLQALDPQEIGADQGKNRSIQVKESRLYMSPCKLLETDRQIFGNTPEFLWIMCRLHMEPITCCTKLFMPIHQF